MKKQTTCLSSQHEPVFMTRFFDGFPPRVRERLRTSRYDLCAACVNGRGVELCEPSEIDPYHPDEELLLEAIDEIERELDSE